MNTKKYGFGKSVQYFAYNDCALKAAHRHQWLAFFDVDEFLVPVASRAVGGSSSDGLHVDGSAAQPADAILNPSAQIPSVQQLLQPYEDYGGVGVTWRHFGTNGHVARPHQLVTQAYTRCYPPDNPDQAHVKVIGNTKYMRSISGACPHMLEYASKAHYTVDVNKTRIDGPKATQPQNYHMVLHHYATKSLIEFVHKMKRGSPDGLGKPIGWLELVDRTSNNTCLDALLISKALDISSKVAAAQTHILRSFSLHNRMKDG